MPFRTKIAETQLIFNRFCLGLFVNSHDAILGTEIIEFSKNMILLLLFINLSAAVGNQSIFFRHARKFFPIEARKNFQRRGW